MNALASPNRSARLLLDPAAPGAWNMAVDEALVESAAEQGQCTLRFYEWSEPTLSLGYFQRFGDRAAHPPSERIAVVRRVSGGGAIVHDRELTYSLAVPVAHPLAADSMRLYDVVHDSLIAALNQWNITAHRCLPTSRLEAAEEPFLCFARRAPGDVLFENFKICGSAQRRRRGAIGQHGSILLTASPAAPELPGLAELTGAAIAPRELIQAWLPSLTDNLKLAVCLEPLLSAEQAAATSLAEEKYATAAWIRRR